MTANKNSGTFRDFKEILPQLIAAISGTLFAISDGISYGWTAPFIPYLESETSHINATELQLEWLETGFLLGCFCGLPVTIYLVDKIGRKKSLLLASFTVLAAWIVIGVANRIEYIIGARFFCGTAGNMAFVAAPMYIAEIADQRIRGFLSSIISLMMLLGCLIVYCVGPYLPFYVPCVIGGCVALIELVTFPNIPESPLFLISKDRPEEAEKALRYFRPNADVKAEMEEISNILEQQRSEKGRIQDLLLVPSIRKGVLIMAVLNSGQHLSAYGVILMNMHVILDSAGSIYLDYRIAAIVFAALMLLAAGLASMQIDKYGRKVFLSISGVLTGLCLLALAVYFHLKDLGFDVISVSWIPIVSVMVYAVVFKMGLGIIPIVITAEIFPTNMKALCMTVSDGWFIIGGIIAIQLYQILKRMYGLFIPFYVFASFSFFITAFTLLFIPETKGKTLDEIQDKLKGRRGIEQVVTKSEK